MTAKRAFGGVWGSEVLYGLSLIFLIFGLINLGWSAWPVGRDAVNLDIPSGILPGAPAGTNYAINTDYVLRVSWPSWVRLGEEGEIQVVLLPDMGESEVTEEESATQIVLIEPTLGMMPVTPAGRLQANLAPDQTLDMSWTVGGEQVGDYAGKVYLSFGFYEQTEEALVAVPVAVVDIAIRVNSLWGLKQPMALWVGFVGLALWGALFLLGRWVQLKGES
jgi:hypothetical protein